MTDTTLPPIASAPAGASEATLAAADQMFEKHGYSEADRVAAGYRKTAAPAAAGKTASEQIVDPFRFGKPASDPAFRPDRSPVSNLPVQQKIDAFQKLRAAGVADDTLQKAAAEEGIAWHEITREAPAPADNTVTLEQANEKLAATSGPLAASTEPSDFSFQFAPEHIDGLDPNEVSDIHSMFQNGFHQSGVPLSVGQSLFRALMDAGNKFVDMSDTERMLAFQTEGQRLQRMGNTETIKADAEYAYSKMPAAFKEVINEHFLMHDADAYYAMSRAGQLMRLRDARIKR